MRKSGRSQIGLHLSRCDAVKAGDGVVTQLWMVGLVWARCQQGTYNRGVLGVRLVPDITEGLVA